LKKTKAKLPTDEDIEWIVNHCQRHPQGPDAWWNTMTCNDPKKLTIREAARLFVDMWVAMNADQ